MNFAYFGTKLSGYVSVVVIGIGALLQVAPTFIPFLPGKEQQMAGQVITFLGGLKAWLSASPLFKAPAQTTKAA